MKKLLKVIFAILSLIAAKNLNAAYYWTRMADFGGGVRDMAFGFSIGYYGYAGTGRNPLDKDDLWQYDPSNNTWTQKANYPGSGRYGLVGFSIGNYGYAGTGWSGIGGGGHQYKDFWQYDPTLNSWTQKNDFGGSARYTAIGFTIGSKGYVGLGYIPMLNDFWEYDPVVDSWTQKTNFPQAREGLVAFAIGNKGYVGMGYSIPAAHYSDLYEFDPASNTWTQKSSMPGLTRRAPVAFVVGNYGFVGMGYNDTTYLTDFCRYDPVNDHWTTIASIGGVPRYWSFAFTIGGHGYVGVGSYAGISNPLRTAEFWRLDECEGSILGIDASPSSKSDIPFSIFADNQKGLILDYDLKSEKNVYFDFYNSLGQLIISTELYSSTHNMKLSVLLKPDIYFYSVSNNEKILCSGKVIVN